MMGLGVTQPEGRKHKRAGPGGEGSGQVAWGCES